MFDIGGQLGSGIGRLASCAPGAMAVCALLLALGCAPDTSGTSQEELPDSGEADLAQGGEDARSEDAAPEEGLADGGEDDATLRDVGAEDAEPADLPGLDAEADASSGEDVRLDVSGDAEPDAEPDAGPHHDLPPPMVLLHLSDIHFGSGSFAIPAFELALADIIPTVDPLLTFATGDLVEVGNNMEAWNAYRQHVDASSLTDMNYIEIPGNHDIYLDLDLSNYVNNTLAGRNGHGLYGLYHYDTDWGRLRIVALDTVSSGDPLRDSTGYLASEQVDALISEMATEETPSDITIVLGHHPRTIDGLSLFNTDDELDRLLDASNALAYLHGHRHMTVINWEDDVLFSMATTLGNPGDENSLGRAGFNIMTIDDGPAVKGVPLDEDRMAVDWPVVMITRPANAALGFDNPRATPLPRSANDQLLRAVVFSPLTAGPAQVRFRVTGGDWQPMSPHGRHYEAWFGTPNGDSCEIEVEALVGADVGRDTIEVNLR